MQASVVDLSVSMMVEDNTKIKFNIELLFTRVNDDGKIGEIV